MVRINDRKHLEGIFTVFFLKSNRVRKGSVAKLLRVIRVTFGFGADYGVVLAPAPFAFPMII
jgi:hypothetical protein